MTSVPDTLYIIELIRATSDGNWASQCGGQIHTSREAARAAIDADESTKPDEFGGSCEVEIVEHDFREYVRERAFLNDRGNQALLWRSGRESDDLYDVFTAAYGRDRTYDRGEESYWVIADEDVIAALRAEG